jgi:hypothetical protein
MAIFSQDVGFHGASLKCYVGLQNNLQVIGMMRGAKVVANHPEGSPRPTADGSKVLGRIDAPLLKALLRKD